MLKIFESFIPAGWRTVPSDVAIYNHSLLVAQAARTIAKRVADLEPDAAFACGLFHDVGKFGLAIKDKHKHPLLGYKMLINEHPKLAHVCIAHPFPVFSNVGYIEYYCRGDAVETEQIVELLSKVDENDLCLNLIQFCDKIARAEEYVSLETKFASYSKRYDSTPELVNPNYEKLRSTKAKLDALAGCDVLKLVIDEAQCGVSDELTTTEST